MGMFGFSAPGSPPPDLTDSYNTALPPDQEQRFQQWRAALPPNLQSTRDYDLRAAFMANAQEAGNGHLTDLGKKPNHMTFSDGSIYSTPQTPGGTWAQTAPETTQNPNGVWQFKASPTNLQYHTPDDLLNYFQAVENNARYGPDGRVIGYGQPNTVVLPNALQQQPAPAPQMSNALQPIPRGLFGSSAR